ncbi:MAG: hypothetical protein ABR887_05800 [Methanoregulaceae archaeon]|jgi:hypothetical protein
MKNSLSFLLLLLFLILIVGCVNNTSNDQYNTPSQNYATPTYVTPLSFETQKEQNIRIAKEVIADYHKDHTYFANNIYVCGDMASDVWDILKTKGINSKIEVGNVNKDISNISEADHAWILAEVASNSWLALETTGGYAVQDNSRYYKGWGFITPKQFKSYLTLETNYNDEVVKINNLKDEYNQKVALYNSQRANYQQMVNYYNSNYVGKPITQDGQNYKKSMDAEAIQVGILLGEVNQLSSALSTENRNLSDILAQMNALVS